MPPPIALARQTRSGVTPDRAVTPPGPTVKPLLTSSKASSAPCACSSSHQAGEVAVVGADDAGVHHHRLHDHAGDLALVSWQQRRSTMARSLKPTTTTRSRMPLGMPVLPATADRPVGRSDLVRVRQHRHLHRVVVAVVAALDLDDQVATGGRAHQVHRVHRRLGAGVGEAPQRQPVAAGQLVGDDDARPRSAGRSGCRGAPAR